MGSHALPVYQESISPAERIGRLAIEDWHECSPVFKMNLLLQLLSYASHM